MNYYFAPMEGITGAVFRRTHHEFVPGIDKYFMPFITPTTQEKLTPRQKRDVLPEYNEGAPAMPQLLTLTAADFIWAANTLASLGYAEVNLNLGCPSGTLTAKGKGAGFLAHPDELDSFLDAVFSACTVPISVKTRLGVHDPAEFEALLEIYSRYPVAELTIHPRVRQDFYKGRVREDAFAAALEKAKAEGRDAVHVRAWLALPAACPSQSHITLDRFTETPGHIAAEDAPQRTVCWEADLTENRAGGAGGGYRETSVYADPIFFFNDSEKTEIYTGEEAPHIVFTPYLRALAAQLTEGIASPAEKAKRIYDYVTLNVRYHFQPSYFVHESIAENCARSRRGDCGIMALTFFTLCRIAGIPARWESGFAVAPGDAGCHDWARFYVAPRGWMYADCSYGASMARRGDELLRRHYFGRLDTGRMVANSAFEAPFDPPMLGFRSDPYDNQSGEMEADGVGLYGDDTVTTKEVLKFEEVE